MGDDTPSVARLRADAVAIFDAGLQAARPDVAVDRAFREHPEIQNRAAEANDVRIVAFGKAAVAMAERTRLRLSESRRVEPGVVVVNDENARDAAGFRVLPTGHPVPDARGVAAAREVRHYLRQARPGDAAVILISGGGSALLPSPAPGLSLDDKIALTERLLASGASIGEINTLRKHLSSLKGGGLARIAAPASVDALILSDVIGDDLSTIASGPTAPDPTTFDDARAILRERELWADCPEAIRQRVFDGCAGRIEDTPDADDPVFDDVRNWLVGTNGLSLDAAAAHAASLGYETIVVSRALTGEAREAARWLADRLTRSVGSTHSAHAAKRDVALLAGGETTVTLRGDGRGGRNQELAMWFALERRTLDRGETRTSEPAWVCLSGGTDGRDGPTDAAGGIADPGTLLRIESAGLDAPLELERNNSYAALDAAGDLFKTGPTGTNVADLQIVLARRA